MGERRENCQRQSGMDCRGCGVAVEIAENVLSKPGKPVVSSIEEIALTRCPEGAKFLLGGNLTELVDGKAKVIQLRTNGESSANQGVLTGTEVAL